MADEPVLYMANVDSDDPGLRILNQSDGSSTELIEGFFSGNFGEFTTRPMDSRLFAVWNWHELFTIDTTTNETTFLANLDMDWFGFASGEHWADAMAISPTNPDVLIVSAADAFDNYSMIRFDLKTLTPISEKIPTDHYWGSMTFTPNGETLLGATSFFDGEDNGQGSYLYEIDPLSGESTLIGATGSDDISGLAFHPDTSELFAIDAFRSDSLVILDPLTGSRSRVIAPTGLRGPDGLAFLPAAVPEPSSHVAIILAICALTATRRSRR